MTRRAARGLLIYAIMILSVASCQAWRVHSAPVDCADDAGHGPDAGMECDHAIAREREDRPANALVAFLGIVLLGAFGLGVHGALRLSLGRESIRRFAEGENRAP
ncbi:MAG TPA: hypothetical protein VEW25_07000 [Allosphingosinicella sp.]|nr:hypothetical protein [Allosphingosinicella sp.]